MSDWQPGDLALCVDTGRKGPWLCSYAKKGRIYTVTRAYVDGIGDLVLGLEGVPCDYMALRFRKVTPPKADEWDRETIALMNGRPVSVCADMLSGVRS